MKMRTHQYWYLLLLVCLNTSVSFAQLNNSGNQNIAQHRDHAWKMVASDNFDVFYHFGDPVLAQTGARYAEEALWDVCRFLDYNNRARYALYVFGSPADLAASNMFPISSPRSGGITPIRNNAAPVVFPGDYASLRKQIRAEVALLLMEDFYFGGGIQASIQNTVLLHSPEWLSEGLTGYLGEGWTYDDELWLSSLEHENLLNYVLEGNEPINRVARKSIWYFIATQYGKEKLAEIFYMTRLSRSAEDGIVHVLGITLKTLTERWREFVYHRITENQNYRDPFDQAGTKLDLPSKERILSMAIHPNGTEVALSLESEGKHKISIFNLSTGERIVTPIQSGNNTDQYHRFWYNLPMAWSPDGSQLMAVTFSDQGQRFVIWKREERTLSDVQFRGTLDRVFGMDWSHDGKRVVVSALRMGQIDLFLSAPGANNFVQLTDDQFDDLEPRFSLDDQRVYFASKRAATNAEAGPFAANLGTTDLWEADIESKALRQVSHSPWVDEYPVKAVSSFELLSRTNQSGLWNLERRNVFTGDSTVMTNLTRGIIQFASADSIFAYTVPEKGRPALYHTTSGQLFKEVVSLKTELRLREDKAMLAQTRAAQQLAMRDSINRTAEELAKRRKKESADSTNGKKINYYVFDGDTEDANKPKKTSNRNRASFIRKEAPAKPDFDQITLKAPGQAKTVWAADRVLSKIGYDPIFRIYTQFEARLKDQRGDKVMTMGFQPYMDLHSADAYFRYQNNKHRFDYFAGLNFSTRFLNRLDFGTRSSSTRLEAGVILPISRYLSTSASWHGLYINRQNLEVRLPKETDGREVLTGVKLDVTYDKTTRNGVFTQKGTWANVAVQDVASLKGRYNQFATVFLDFRNYLPLARFVFANRISGAYSAGRYPQRYFLGGTDDWFLGRFENPSDFPIDQELAALHYMNYASPIRGFRFNARNGTRYLAYNAELRIPVSRILKTSLNSDPLYKFEIIPFFDFGTAWSVGNPFSQRNPIESEVIDSYPLTITVQTLKSPFIMGFGAGTRFQMFGYGVRFDLAWGIEDYSVQKPMLHISLGKNF